MSSLSESSSDSDDDTEGLLRKALDVDLPGDFNPNSVPQNGMEYLHHVIYERSKCKKLVTSNIDPNKFRNNQTFSVPVKKTATANTCQKYLPSLDWQLTKLSNFRYFKQVVENLKENKCVPTITTFNEDDFLVKLKTEGPLYSKFLHYTQSAKIRMLELITKHFYSNNNIWKLTDSVGEWIFAILVTLTIPLSPSCCHAIREFTRTCRDIRSKYSEDIAEEEYDPLNFYICICGRYFGQLDLAD